MYPKPLFARVLLRRDIQKKSGSIIIPQHLQKANAQDVGVVVAVGPTCDETVRVGQRVLFGKFAGAWLKHPDFPNDEEREFYVIQDEDVICVLAEPR